MAAEEELFEARDAASGAKMLALLVACAAAVHLVCTHWTAGVAVPALVQATRVVELGAAAAALTALFATRQRPRASVALVAGGLLVALFFVVLPVQAVAWRHAGRPWEATADLHFATMVVALAAPGSFALGLGVLAGLAVEGLAIHAWLRAAGTPPGELIAGEPALTIVFVIIGVAVLVVRRRRRALAWRFLGRAADLLALTRLSERLDEIAVELGDAAGALAAAMAPLRGCGDIVVERVERALGRIGAVRGGLERVVELGRVVPSLDEEERVFWARDAHHAALTLTVAITIVETVAVLGTRGLAVGRMQAFFVFSGALAAVSTLALLAVRRRPSERFAFAVFLVNILPAFAQYWYATPAWAGTHAAFDPLAGNKTFLVLVPLIVPRRAAVAVTIEVAMAAMSVALYHHHHLDAAVTRSPFAEPWATVLYLLVGLGLVATRENRRLVSVRLLRADREVATLLSSAELSLTLLDQLGTPLQVVGFGVEQLRVAGADAAVVERMQAAFARLAAVSRRVPPADPGSIECLAVAPPWR